MDSYSSNASNRDLRTILGKIKTEITFFPRNITDPFQPADSFIIQYVKATWIKR